jgi:PAS domain S-box-containing protein
MMIGKMSKEIENSLLETIPLEFSVLDSNDRVLAWNRHETRIFKRSEQALGRNVRDCHPEKSLAKVEQILKEMKSGKRDVAEFWIDIPLGKSGKKHKILIRYFALRDGKRKYLGCLETTQDITFMRELKGEKRLLG